MNVLIINPTSNESLNDKLFASADLSAKRTARNSEDYTHISVMNLKEAPRYIETELDVLRVSALLMEKLEGVKDVYDGFIIAHHAELGTHALRELTGKPVILAGAACAYATPLYGHCIAILASTKHDVETEKDTLRRYGILSDYMHFFPITETGRLEGQDLEKATMAAAHQAKNAIEADVVVLADSSVGGVTDKLIEELKIPVFDCMTSCIIRIEYMILQNGQSFD